MNKWMIAPGSKTFIYELGEKGTNRWFCQIQSAGPERATLEECEKVAALMHDAPALLDALQTMTQLARIKWGNLDAEVFAEIEKAEAMIAKHRGGV